MRERTTHPIGVFDSGVGGLTVYKALRDLMPYENFVYLGDTARLPYGTKSADTVAQYALQATSLLMKEDIKLLVIACNTASAHALNVLRATYTHLPCLDVIGPGAEAACAASEDGRIAILATEGTVRSGAYSRAITKIRPDAHIETLACNLLVALVEEGWTESLEADTIVRRYLCELGNNFDTLVLGCTHFPMLAPTILRLLGPKIRVIDSAATTARSVLTYLTTHLLLNPSSHKGKCRFMVTDLPERFGHLAERFLGEDIGPNIFMTDHHLMSSKTVTRNKKEAIG